jgi:hypothetical protein
MKKRPLLHLDCLMRAMNFDCLASLVHVAHAVTSLNSGHQPKSFAHEPEERSLSLTNCVNVCERVALVAHSSSQIARRA